MSKKPPDSVDQQGASSGVSDSSRLRHDVLTPINHLLGYSEMLLEELAVREQEELNEQVREIHAATKEAHFLIQQMLPAGQDTTDDKLSSLELLLAAPMSIVRNQVAAIRSDSAEPLRSSIEADLERIDQAAQKLMSIVSAFPAASAPSAFPLETQPYPLQVEPESVRRRGGRILVVDDDAANRDILVRRLHRDGFEVEQASSGRETLAMLGSANYDIVLLDVMMPDINGLQLLRQLKADPALSDLPIIMISAMDEVEGAVRCIGLGAEDFLTKPFDPVLLRTRVGASLDKKRLRDEERLSAEKLRRALDEVERERQRSELLLRNILPPKISDELRDNGYVTPKYLDDVSIVFTDFVGFTLSTERLAAEELVEILHTYFTAFDRIVRRYNLEKLKTIGDSYMCIGGLPPRSPSHPVDAVLACMEIIHTVEQLADENPVQWKVRIGLHTGPVIAGVVGIDKFAFDVWGETVNYSSRMESGGEPGRINISERAYSRVRDFFECQHRGQISTKEQRPLDMYFVNRVQPKLMGDLSAMPPPQFVRRYKTYFERDPPSFPPFLAGVGG